MESRSRLTSCFGTLLTASQQMKAEIPVIPRCQHRGSTRRVSLATVRRTKSD